MKLCCCFTPAHQVLYTDHFLPSVPEGFSVCAEAMEIDGSGDFLSPEFLECVRRKVRSIIQSIDANPGEILVWSDVDIVFVRVTPGELIRDLGASEIAFQREARVGREVNTGFFVCRCTERVRSLFAAVLELMERDSAINEQMAVNQLISQRTAAADVALLPLRYYARTHGWPPPPDLALYHANKTFGPNGVASKLAQFRELDFLRRYGWAARFLTSLKYALARLARDFSGFFRR